MSGEGGGASGGGADAEDGLRGADDGETVFLGEVVGVWVGEDVGCDGGGDRDAGWGCVECGSGRA